MKRITKVELTREIGSIDGTDEMNLHELDIISTGNNRATLLLTQEELVYIHTTIKAFLDDMLTEDDEMYESIIRKMEGRE
jgi:hypothetical protein